jgi:hypothetical protein
MGPSQICECPFREPRVFEIALLMKKQHWLQIVVRLKTWDTWRNFLERMTWNQQLEQLRTWFVIIHDAPLMHHWITSAFLFSQWTRQIGPSTHFDLRNGLRCHRFDIARNRPGDHTVIILAHCQCCYFQDLQPRRTSLWHKLSQAGGPPKSICRAKGLLWMPWT